MSKQKLTILAALSAFVGLVVTAQVGPTRFALAVAAPEITSDGGGPTASVNAAENQTSVTDVQATDLDGDTEGSGLSYSITGGADASFFALDPNTGVLTFTSARDFEAPADAGTNNVYDVQVTVTDSELLTDTQDIAVTVTDVVENTAPTITSSASASVPENQTSAIDVQSTDDSDSEGSGLTYSKTGGVDQALFTLNATTGVLTFNAAPDFESPADFGANNVYDVQVTVTDSGLLTDVQNIAITVTDAAENLAPSITSSASASVPENQTSAIDVQSTDDSDSEGSGLTYSKTGGADQALFTLNASTGVLTFASAPDFEAPADSGGDNVYDVQVTVTDSGSLTDVQNISITVTDAADNTAPTITSSASASVPENQTSAIDVQSTDDSDSEGSGLIYSKTGGADQALFTLNATTGVLTFNAAPDFESPADSGTDNTYNVQVTVTDSGSLTDVQNVAITVTDVAENTAPTITSSPSALVPENQTSAIDVQSTDDSDSEGSGLTYAKTGGLDQALFTLNASTGVLTFSAAPNFELPGDSGANNVYDVQVTVTDSGSLTDVQNIAITVIDVVENSAPTITSPASASVPENQTSAINVQATDDLDSEGSGLTYSKTGGVDQALFTLDASTGLLTFNAAPDFESPGDSGGNNVYNVQVTVTDSGLLTDVQDIAITVTDVPENVAPTITSPAATSVSENQVSGIDVQTSDDSDSEGSGLTYSKTGGADHALFTLNTTTGVLTFTAVPDFESPADAGANNVYNVQVTVTDSGSLTDVQSIAITVTNVNESPTISSPASASVPENQVSAIDVQTSDDSDLEGSGLTYSKTGGVDQALFTLNASTGVLTFASAPDFESPADSGGNNTYDVQVTVTDSGSLTDVQDIAITVTDVVENTAPTITPPASASVPENQTSAIDVQSTDDFDSEGSGLTYSKTGGADQTLFTLDASTGILTFDASPDFESPTDSGADNTYNVQVTVTDSGLLTDVQNIAITVTNVNESPSITSSASASAPENQTSAINVHSTDDSDSEGSGLTYSKTGGADQALFTLGATTGVITFNAAPDFESPADFGANNVYDVQVTVTDSGLLTDVQNIVITVTNVNESPTINSSASASLAENQTLAIDVQATDDSDSEGSGLIYSKTGGADQALFTLNASTGVLSFNAAPDFEVPADSGADNIYNVQVTVTDSGSLDDVQNIAITVTDVPENTAPTITSLASASVPENQISAINVQSTDDSDSEGSGLTYSKGPGFDSAFFSVNSATGVLTFAAPPDFENPLDDNTNNVYNVQVIVTDSGSLTDSQTVSVTVTDVNEEPTITSGSTASVPENTTFVVDVASTDPEGQTENGGGLKYSISGGADQSLFSITTDTGIVSFITAPDFEAPRSNVYEVEVTVTDTGSPAASSSQVITVTVTNENEAPDITSSSSASVVENSTFIVDIQSSDPEGQTESGGGLTYSITGGADQSLFSIASNTGIVSFIAAPDFEAPRSNIYLVEVMVTDSGSPAQSASQLISVTVTNVNEAPSVTSGSTASVPENTTSVIDVDAADPDGDTENGGGLAYTITGGANQSLFSITDATGVLTFDSAPDFETGSGPYFVEVTVTDSGSPTLSSSQLITVTVEDVNEAPSITPVSPIPVLVEENTTSVVDVDATDPDGDTENGGGLTYSKTGLDASLFELDSSTGALSFLAAPDFETRTSYSVQVIVTDSGLLSDSQTVSITVTDVNETPTITSPSSVSVAENTTLVIDVDSTDPDGDTEIDGELSYEITGGADQSFFSVVSGTGVLTFASPPDFEDSRSSVYVVEVTVTDSGFPRASSSQTISVTVTDVDENLAPVITSQSSISVLENQTSVIDVEATDDHDSEGPGGGLTYTINGGVDRLLFTIDSFSGVLKFINAPDFETRSTPYVVTVSVTDLGFPAGSHQKSTTRTFTVTVTNANIEAPAGTVKLQGLPDQASSPSIHAAQFAAISPVVFVERVSDGGIVDSAPVNPDGSFSFSLAPQSGLRLRVVASGYMSHVLGSGPGEAIDVSTGDFNVPSVTVLGGLLTSENITVDGTDLSAFLSVLDLEAPVIGRTKGGVLADINADGVVDTADLDIIGSNFGKSGDQPWQ